MMEHFRDILLALIRRDILAPRPGQLPPILADGKDTDITSDLSRDQRLLLDVFWGVVDIWKSYDVLRDVETYLARAPRAVSRIPRSRYLLYHVAVYLNETYLLKERIETLCASLTRKYRRNPPSHHSVLDAARDAAVASLATVTAARGTHVHDKRFNTPSLHQLAGLELALQTHSDFPKNLLYLRILQRLSRDETSHWRRTIR